MTGIGRLQRGALSVLLFAGVLSPVAAAALGWELFLPPAPALAAIVAVVLGTVILRQSSWGIGYRMMGVGLAVALAVPFAAILRAQSNAFYTSAALLGGLIVLLTLYVAGSALRHVVLHDESQASTEPVAVLTPAASIVTGLERLPPNEIRVVHVGHAAASERAAGDRPAGVPAIALGDSLAVAGAWLVGAFWVLVALGHRHVASGALLMMGALLTMRSLALVPEFIATRGRDARPND